MKTILDLGSIPLVNNLLDTKEESLAATKYELCIKEDSDMIMHLSKKLDTSLMFSNYLYRSSTSAPFIEHCRNMYFETKIFTDDPKTIVDIGGNDGALLSAFKKEINKDILLINVDPSTSFKEDNELKQIKYYNAFWPYINLESKADIIVSTNVFQHNTDYRPFVEGISKNLDGIWILEFPYFLDTVKTNQFDQTYHEHYYYWLVTPLVKIFREFGLNIVDISYQSIHGGSLRIISSNKKNSYEYKERINYFLDMENKFNFSNWSDQIAKKIEEDRKKIDNVDGNILLFGAAAKGCVYLNTVGHQRYKYVIDDTVQKQNKFIPGTSIQVASRKIIKEENPDYILILAHNFKDYIINSLKASGYKGKFIVMIPEFKIYE